MTLDLEIQEQLKNVFAKLESDIHFELAPGEHADRAELVQFLSSVASTSSKLKLTESRDTTLGAKPLTFFLLKDGLPTRISFRGIPTGHEFTSLVVAILQVDGKGKWPDPGILERIKKIKGPIRLQTFISLTCENCPDVVQALNMMSLVHPNFTHQMIDGQYAQEEIEKLKIQGVPSVIGDESLVHSGKINLVSLIETLEKKYGIDDSLGAVANKDLGFFDVAVLGGGPAGVSAAIYSARKGLRTAIIAERIGGQVQDTKGIENLISVVYTEGPQLSQQLMEHLNAYPVKLLEHRRVQSIDQKTMRVTLASEEFLKAGSIIVTTGAKWRELNVPGEKDYLGRGVAYCPHCDGPYYKGKKVAVVGGGNSGVEAALDLANIVKEVVLFEFNDSLKADQVLVEKLKATANVSIIMSAQTSEVIGDGGKVTGLKYIDRITKAEKTEILDGIFVQIGLLPNSQMMKGVVELNKFGEIIVDEKGRTSVAGIYAAGDVTTTPFKQIIIAMGEGAKAALAMFEDRMHAKTPA